MKSFLSIISTFPTMVADTLTPTIATLFANVCHELVAAESSSQNSVTLLSLYTSYLGPLCYQYLKKRKFALHYKTATEFSKEWI